MYYAITLNGKVIKDRDFRSYIYQYKEYAEKGMIELKRWNHDAKYEIIPMEVTINVTSPVLG